MKKIPLRNVSVKDRLAIDIRIESSVPDVEHRLSIDRGTPLKPKHINRLKKEGIRSVFIKEPMTSDLVDKIRSEEIQESEQEITENLREATHSLEDDDAFYLPADELKNKILELIDTLQSTEASVAYTSMKSHADYLAKHGFDVCKLAINFCLCYQDELLGKYAFGTPGQPIDSSEFPLLLGLGTLLQDLGNWEIPADILQKTSSLSDVEWEAIKRHPELGSQIIRKLEGVHDACTSPAREHHERYDGSGYPEGKGGNDIHIMGRIAGICDVYTALTSERPYRIELTPSRALEIMKTMQQDGPAFDPDLMELFLEMMPPFPVGQEVVLSDGTRGVVSDLSEGFEYPKIRVLYERDQKLDEYYEITANKDNSPVILN